MKGYDSLKLRSLALLRTGLLAFCAAVSVCGVGMSVDAAALHTHAGVSAPGKPATPSKNNRATYTLFDVPGSTDTELYDNNAAGNVTGFYRIAGVAHGFIGLADGTIITDGMDFPGATNTNTYGIDDDNSVAGTYTDAQGRPHGYVRSPDGNFTSFDPKGSKATDIYVIHDGYIPGDYADKNGRHHGFLRAPNGGIETIDVQEATDTYAYDVSNGRVVGYYFDGTTIRCFLRNSDGRIITFGVENSPDTECVSIDENGAVTGYYSDSAGSYHGALWSAKKMKLTSFDVPGDTGGTYPNSMNNSETIVGEWEDASGVVHSFIRFRNGKIKSYDLKGSTHTNAIDINDSGEIVGYYYDGFRQRHGYQRTP
ncbi:MAG: hypothetical protein WDM89_18270 [Rhizomicrobium sp.]